ncbi:MAG: hypothetical protein QW057_07670 [Candidatus Bathyarchaeia archaeon]
MEIEGEAAHLFLYDVGGELDLKKAEEALRKPPQFVKFEERLPFPRYVRMTPYPLFLRLDERQLGVPVRVQVRLHHIGAISVVFRYSFACHIRELPRYGRAVVTTPKGEFELASLGDEIRAAIEERIGSCIVRIYQREPVPEEYTAIAIRRLGTPYTAEAFLRKYGRLVAAMLREEEDPDELSDSEVMEALRETQSFYRESARVIDWGATFILEPKREYESDLLIAELANLQLLELRVYDRILDAKIDAVYDDVRRVLRVGRHRFWPSHSVEKVAAEVSEIEADLAQVLSDIRNVTKFVGDWDLARYYRSLTRRFHLDDWEKAVQQKLETVRHIYTLVMDKAGHERSETLEILVILLILVEVALSLLSYGGFIRR